MSRRSILDVGAGIQLRGLRLMEDMRLRLWIMGMILVRGVMCRMRSGVSLISFLHKL
jgi:hypothetical protein